MYLLSPLALDLPAFDPRNHRNVHLYIPQSKIALENKMGSIGGSKMMRNHLKEEKKANEIKLMEKPQSKCTPF